MSLPGCIAVGHVQVRLRPVCDADRGFLYSVYASTRADELQAVPWTAGQKEAFLRQQFAAQDHAYRSNYPGAEFLIISVDNADAGRLFIHRRAAEIRVMDIALLPQFRNRGIGSSILRCITAEGAQTGQSVSIHVEAFSPARHLYERLGFRTTTSNQVYLLMEWRKEVSLC